MIIDPNTQLGVLYQEFEEVSAENILKLSQILDLETILYNTHVIDLDDKSPCWCIVPDLIEGAEHEKFCDDARQATYHLWHY
jgi:hypothetical protein